MDKSEWIEQLVRTDQGAVVKRIIESQPEGRKRMGRPRLRWLKDVGRDLREMNVNRWRQKAAFVIREAKTLRQPQNQHVSK